MAETYAQAQIQCIEGELKGTDPIYLLFNPETITISRALKWTKTSKPSADREETDYGGGGVEKFSIGDIVFDATIPKLLKNLGKKSNVISSGSIAEDINMLTVFTYIDDTIKPPRPPKCQFKWGDYFTYDLYVSSINVVYELFEGSGKPLRAKVSLEFISALEPFPPQNPTSRSLARKVRTVLDGETLDWIAYQEYGSAAAWRYIAETNNLDDPSALRAGQVLRLLPLK